MMEHLLLTIVGVALGATYLIAAVHKLLRPRGFIVAVAAYEVLSFPVSVVYALVVPYLELLGDSQAICGPFGQSYYCCNLQNQYYECYLCCDSNSNPVCGVSIFVSPQCPNSPSRR